MSTPTKMNMLLDNHIERGVKAKKFIGAFGGKQTHQEAVKKLKTQLYWSMA